MRVECGRTLRIKRIQVKRKHCLDGLVEPLVQMHDGPRNPARNLFDDGPLEQGHLAHNGFAEQRNVILLVARAISGTQAVGQNSDARRNGPSWVRDIGRQTQELPVVARHVLKNSKSLARRKGSVEHIGPSSAL